MKTTRNNTYAIKYLMDEIFSPEDFVAASSEKVDSYLTANGVELADLDKRMDQFLRRLGGKVAMAQAARQRPCTEQVESRRAELARLSDAQILAKLIAKYGSQENIPLAARTKGALGRKELESLYLDAGD